MCKYIVVLDRPQIIIWRMRIAWWIPNATQVYCLYFKLNNCCWKLDVRFERFLLFQGPFWTQANIHALCMNGRAVNGGINYRSLTTYSRCRSRANPYIFCWWQTGTETDLSSCTSLLLWQYHSNNVPFSPSAKWDLQKSNGRRLYTQDKEISFHMSGRVTQKSTFTILLFWMSCLLHNVLLLKYTKRYYIT